MSTDVPTNEDEPVKLEMPRGRLKTGFLSHGLLAAIGSGGIVQGTESGRFRMDAPNISTELRTVEDKPRWGVGTGKCSDCGTIISHNKEYCRKCKDEAGL